MTGRYELKYLCRNQELALIENRLSHLAHRDRHAGQSGTYSISSLYFDDWNDSCCKDNEAGNPERYKFRARYYGEDISSLHLEKKVRRYGVGYKFSCPLTPGQLEKFFTGDTQSLLYDTPPLLRELAILHQTRRMEPRVIVRYERTPFVWEAGNVRITLDRSICAGAALTEFLSGDYQHYPVQGAGESLLEVKFDTVLSGELRQAAYLDRLQQISFSKYYLCRQFFGRKGVTPWTTF